MRDPEGPNEGFSVDGVPVHKLDMTAGAAAMIARRADFRHLAKWPFRFFASHKKWDSYLLSAVGSVPLY